MSMHIVSRVNNRWRCGTWFQCFDHGCQEVKIETVDNRVKVAKEVGLVIPFGEIKDYITTTMKRGLNRFDQQIETPRKRNGG